MQFVGYAWHFTRVVIQFRYHEGFQTHVPRTRVTHKACSVSQPPKNPLFDIHPLWIPSCAVPHQWRSDPAPPKTLEPPTTTTSTYWTGTSSSRPSSSSLTRRLSPSISPSRGSSTPGTAMPIRPSSSIAHCNWDRCCSRPASARPEDEPPSTTPSPGLSLPTSPSK